MSAESRSWLERVQRWALVAAVVGGLGCGLGWALSPVSFATGYLVAYLFWLAFPIGALALLMVHNLTGGGWGRAIRPELEAAVATIPLLAVLFIPIALSIGALYPWAGSAPDAGPAEAHLIEHRELYLNAPFFYARAASYFVIWSLLAFFLVRWSRAQERPGGPPLGERLRTLSGPGLVIYAFTVTFASIDWAKSMAVLWFSSMHGVRFIASQPLAALALVIGGAVLLARRRRGVTRAVDLHDLGNLLLALVMVWAYLSIMEYLIVWSGNLRETVPFYIDRTTGGWQWVARFLMVFHFAAPFIVLLSRDAKRRAVVLGALAGWILLVRYVDLYWLVLPSYPTHGVAPHVLDLAGLAAIGGLWVWCYAALLLRWAPADAAATTSARGGGEAR